MNPLSESPWEAFRVVAQISPASGNFFDGLLNVLHTVSISSQKLIGLDWGCYDLGNSFLSESAANFPVSVFGEPEITLPVKTIACVAHYRADCSCARYTVLADILVQGRRR